MSAKPTSKIICRRSLTIMPDGQRIPKAEFSIEREISSSADESKQLDEAEAIVLAKLSRFEESVSKPKTRVVPATPPASALRYPKPDAPPAGASEPANSNDVSLPSPGQVEKLRWTAGEKNPSIEWTFAEPRDVSEEVKNIAQGLRDAVVKNYQATAHTLKHGSYIYWVSLGRGEPPTEFINRKSIRA